MYIFAPLFSNLLKNICIFHVCIRASSIRMWVGIFSQSKNLVSHLLKLKPLYRLVGSPYEPTNESDVSLLTQFTIARYDKFVRLVQAWDGPIHAAFYGSDQEVIQFENLWAKFKSGNADNKISIHVVYSREVTVPNIQE